MTEQAELNRPQSARKIETVNPATGEPGRSYDETSLGDALAAAAAARQAFLEWRRTGFAERSGIVHKAAAILRARKDEFARLMTEEMGKTLTDGRAEVEKCAAHCDWFADHAARISCRRAGRPRRRRGVRHLQSARNRARGDAVEFPLLAGVPLRRARADGRQWRAAEACQQRPRLRARDRGGASSGGRASRPVPDAAPAEQRGRRR